MPAFAPLRNIHTRIRRAAAVLAGVFLLLLQNFSPVLASSDQGVWIEICGDAGAVWVQVDLDDNTGDPGLPCPKCADCALCAVTATAPLPDLPQVTQTGSGRRAQCQSSESVETYRLNWLWPETRGPPCEPQIKTERAPRASMTFTQITGGAPWS